MEALAGAGPPMVKGADMTVLMMILLAAGSWVLLAGGRVRTRELLSRSRTGMPGISGGRNASSGPASGASRAGPDNSRAMAPDPALLLDLIGAMLDAGASLEQAVAILAETTDPQTAGRLTAVTGALSLGMPWAAAWHLAIPADTGNEGQTLVLLRDALTFAGATGAPSSSILYARAMQLRRRRNREAEKRAAALGVRLVIPLGACALPAFVCLGVVPVLLSLLPTLA
jgi:Type II secretion system (T2SS), protein F